MNSIPLPTRLEAAFGARAGWMDAAHQGALRLFNGFTEGCPEIAIDLYARTAVIHDYANDKEQGAELVNEAAGMLKEALPWLQGILLKRRNSLLPQERRGQLIHGTEVADRVLEHGTWYALNLTLNRDASLYLDTRGLRRWAIENLKGKSVLNLFAYTGSFGVAALKGGASRVVQVDLNREFLNLARRSYALNGFALQKGGLVARDFFEQVADMKRRQTLFDCVMIDPPFFSTTSMGRVDLVHESQRMINKVRPLVQDGGTLVAVNNALYVSGKEYMETLEGLCKDGYLHVRELVHVPEDFTGFPETQVGSPVTDPTPFNHSTKIAILEVRRK